MQDNIEAAPAVEAPEVPQTPPVAMTPFDAIQQSKVTELIIKAKRDAARELRADRDRALKENETLRASLNLPQETIDHLESVNQKLLEAKAEHARYDGLNKAEKKRQALFSAAQSVNFFDSQIGATLLAAEVTFGEGDALQVIDPATGEARITALGEPMTIADLAREKSAQHPYMIKSTFKPGAGSTMQDNRPVEDPFPLADYFGKNAFGPLAHRLAKSDPRKYAELRRAAVAKGLLPG